MSTYLFAVLGTLGDVRPMLALAVAVQSQGHSVRFAVTPKFGALVEHHGIEAIVMGDDAYLDTSEGRLAMSDPVLGFENFLALANFGQFDALFEALDRAAEGVHAVVASPFVIPAHLVAQSRRLPLINCALSPSALTAQPGRDRLADPLLMTWRRVLNSKRQNLGLERRAIPQMERLTSAALTLGLYPPMLASEAPYAAMPVELGYPRLRDDQQASLDADLEAWLRHGPFATFTFGSFIDREAEHYLAVSREVCARMGLRCLYLSPYGETRLQSDSEAVRVQGYAPHALIMPRASVVVHHGGMGCLVEACEAAAPTVIIPFALDQPHNASRMSSLGLAETVQPNQYQSGPLTHALSKALQTRDTVKDRLKRAGYRQQGPAAMQAATVLERFLH